MKYQRIVLKISGEALAGSQGHGINPQVIKQVAQKVKSLYSTGIQIAIVCGGGNMWRGVTGAQLGMERSRADYIGMLATVMNSLALEDGFQSAGIPATVQTSIPIQQVAAPYRLSAALNELRHHQVVIFGGGIGNPYFSTDTTAVLRAAEIHADAILMAKNGVDGVYSADPNQDPHATKYAHLRYVDLIQKHLKVMDMTACSLAMENRIPLVVFDFKQAGSLNRIVSGAPIGTLID